MTASLTSINRPPVSRDAGVPLRFFGVCSIMVMACALFCGAAPIALSIATVFLFAGPHNWMEVRYFLSRLPARFGHFKTYFATGMIGAVLLAAATFAITSLGKFEVIDTDTWINLYKLSNVALIFWIGALVTLRRELSNAKQITLSIVAALACAAAWLEPGYFAVALVYSHPLVALVMLDIELRRGKPHLVTPYRCALALIPLMIAALWWHFSGAPTIETTDPLIAQICRHAGADYITDVSTHFLVATHTFLETLHYCVWLLAIPLLSSGWSKWRARSMPVTVLSSAGKKMVRGLLLFSTFAVCVLWLCFGINFNVAREWYFTLAMIHVLAEIPFLIRFL